MKKLVFIVTMFFSFSVFGQTEKGTVFIGVGTNLNLSFIESGSKSDTSDYKKNGSTDNYNASLSGGYFLNDNFLVGASLQLLKYKSSLGILTKSSSIAVSPFVRYYFGEERTKYFVNGAVGFGNTSVTNTIDAFNNIEFRSNDFSYKLGGGVSIFLRKNIALEIGVGYDHRTSKAKDNPSNYTSINKGFRSNVGFSIFL